MILQGGVRQLREKVTALLDQFFASSTRSPNLTVA